MLTGARIHARRSRGGRWANRRRERLIRGSRAKSRQQAHYSSGSGSARLGTWIVCVHWTQGRRRTAMWESCAPRGPSRRCLPRPRKHKVSRVWYSRRAYRGVGTGPPPRQVACGTSALESTAQGRKTGAEQVRYTPWLLEALTNEEAESELTGPFHCSAGRGRRVKLIIVPRRGPVRCNSRR